MCESCQADPRGICFRHKLKTLRFGVVPGGFRDVNSTSMYDAQDETLKFFPSREEVMDHRSDFAKEWPDID